MRMQVKYFKRMSSGSLLREFVENHPHDVDGKKDFWELMLEKTFERPKANIYQMKQLDAWR